MFLYSLTLNSEIYFLIYVQSKNVLRRKDIFYIPVQKSEWLPSTLKNTGLNQKMGTKWRDEKKMKWGLKDDFLRIIFEKLI